MPAALGTADGSAGPVGQPELSLVVAVHDVEPWVDSCLASIVTSAPDGTEVILVDDGSTDGSGEVCDRYAAAHPSWRVIHQPNAGLGAARNVGMAEASGDYVGFVDGDDLLLPAYTTMLRRAQHAGADVATGAVQRTDGSRAWRSGLHSRALDTVGEVASLREDLSLIYDTTAWNKVYRRSFLQQHALRFPEGVLYEDLPVTVRALYFAGSVPCVHEPVYSWRTREEGGSITQRRNELANLVDRFAAVRDVDGFLAEHELADLRAAHDLKVLGLDLPLYTSALPEADDEYRGTYRPSSSTSSGTCPRTGGTRSLPPCASTSSSPRPAGWRTSWRPCAPAGGRGPGPRTTPAGGSSAFARTSRPTAWSWSSAW
jgi:CDP-glycerol glycerophosphotransferase